MLLSILFLTYGYQGYKIVDQYARDEVKIKTSGKLSDITSRVIPVPLETPDSGAVHQARRVQKDGNHLFLIDNNRLLHFDMEGKFINQPAAEISNREDLFIADYTLDTDRHQIVLIDSQRNISRYDYAGNLLSVTKITHPWHKITALAYHNGYLWATAEKVIKNDNDTDLFQLVHCLYQLDTDMNEISSRQLHTAEVGRNMPINTYCVDQLLVDEQEVYAYASPANMNYLLNDTLHIAQHRSFPLMHGQPANEHACIYPVRKGKRHMLSTYHYTADDCYTFCFDQENQTAYMLTDGFKDDFFHTGYVANLQSMDIYNQSYCFLKSGADVASRFPDRSANNEHPVLFIVTLNT